MSPEGTGDGESQEPHGHKRKADIAPDDDPKPKLKKQKTKRGTLSPTRRSRRIQNLPSCPPLGNNEEPNSKPFDAPASLDLERDNTKGHKQLSDLPPIDESGDHESLKEVLSEVPSEAQSGDQLAKDATSEAQSEDLLAKDAPPEDQSEDLLAKDAPPEDQSEDLLAKDAPPKDQLEDHMEDAPPEDQSEDLLAKDAPPEDQSEDLLAKDAPPEDQSEDLLAKDAPPEDQSEDQLDDFTDEDDQSSDDSIDDEPPIASIVTKQANRSPKPAKAKTEAELLAAFKENFPGVRFGLGTTTNTSVLAGYLGFSHVAEFADFMSGKTLHTILRRSLIIENTIQEDEATSISTSASKRKSKPPSGRSKSNQQKPKSVPKMRLNPVVLNQLLASSSRYMDKMKAIKKMSLNDDALSQFEANVTNKVRFHANVLGAIILIVKRHPDIFKDTHLKNVSPTKSIHGFHPEDLNRAFLVRNYWMTSHMARKGLNPGQQAAPPQYLTEDQYIQSQQGSTQITSQVNAHGADPEAVYAQHMAALEQTSYIPDKHSESFQDMCHAAEAGINELDTQIANTKGDTKPKATFSDEGRYLFLSNARKMVNVLFDKLTGIESTDGVDKAMTLALRQDEGDDNEVDDEIDAAGLGDDDQVNGVDIGVDDTEGKDDRQRTHEAKTIEFWQERRRGTRLSVTPPTFSEACRILNIPEDAEWKDKPQFHDLGLKVVAKALQIQGVAWMRQQAQSPIKGGMISDECGCGKTIQTLIYLSLRARDALVAAEAGEDFDNRPTLIVAPPDVVTVWQNEIAKHFRDALHVKVYYGGASDFSAESASDGLFGTPDEVRREFMARFPADDPKSARGVLLTSYTTWSLRTLREERKSAGRKNAAKTDSLQEEQEEKDHFGPSTPMAKRQKEKERQRINRMFSLPPDELLDEVASPSNQFDIVVPDPLKKNKSKDTTVDDAEYTYSSKWKNVFGVVVCDESHSIKNPRTRNHRSVVVLYAPTYWLLSATPLYNTVSDLLGYLVLLSRTQWYVECEGWETRKFYEDSDYKIIPSNKEMFPTAEDYHRKFGNLRLWVLNPRTFISTVNRDQFGNAGSEYVLPAILQLIQLRRRMADKIQAWDVQFSISDDIPMYHIANVELAFHPMDHTRYLSMWAGYQASLSRRPGKVGSATKLAVPGLRDMASFRWVSLTAFDFKLNNLLERIGLNSHAKHVKTFSERFVDSGVEYYRVNTIDDPRLPPYTDPASILTALTLGSPKLRYICHLLGEGLYAKDKAVRGKTIILCNWPIEIWVIDFMLNLLNIQHLTVRSGDKTSHRAEVYALFNDPGDKCQVLLCSIRNAGQGVNLQLGCHRLIITGMPNNVSTLVQAIGRIHRLGQKHEQYIWILNVNNTYDQVQQSRVVSKFMGQVAGDLEVPPIKEGAYEQYVEDVRAGKVDIPAKDQGRCITQHYFEQKYKDDYYNQHINKLLGIRSSRLTWTTDNVAEENDSSTFPPDSVRKPFELKPHKSRRATDSTVAGDAASPADVENEEGELVA